MATPFSAPSMIVGVGASAGGLAAFESFLQGIREGTPFGYVLIQHLDPHHDSELSGLLQRVTPATVQLVEDEMPVEAGGVYVIPAGRLLCIEDGRLRLYKPEDGPSVRVPIDTFLRSLAEDQGSNAACIILSGTGTDGTLGLKAVKEKGGICMVQDPAEAEYGGMPESAIATALVDVVAPAGKLSDRLNTYLDTNPRLPVPSNGEADVSTDDRTEEETALLQIFQLLKGQTGLDFSGYKPATIRRRIRHRMQLLQIDTLANYLDRLREHPGERDTLSREFLISVTNFFRDPEAFASLASRVLPTLFANKNENETIRVWVPGCATGEEAYSLLMLLLEHRGRQTQRPSIQIFATDVDEKALRHARMGFYPSSIASDVSSERLKRFFIREDEGYRIRPELRESILFAEHNLLDDPPFSDLDLISCRNVLIYLKPETQRSVLQLFHYALAEKGFLFLGRSESTEAKDGLFTPFKNTLNLYRLKSRDVDYTHPLLAKPVPDVLGLRSNHQETERSRVKRLHRRLVKERFLPASALVDDSFSIVHMMGEVKKYLKVPSGLPSKMIADLVPNPLQAELRAALFGAFHQGASATLRHYPDSGGTEDERDGDIQSPTIVTVEPILPEASAKGGASDDGYALVTFQEQTQDVEQDEGGVEDHGDEDTPADQTVERLRDELGRTRHRLEVVTEEYETSNEELMTSNEELQSANEELRATMERLQANREEMQSTNEELVTVNQELRKKIDALNRRNSDIQNLMEATEVGTLFLNTNLELRQYTARASDLFNVIPSDVGRPFTHLSHHFEYGGFVEDAHTVLEQEAPAERELQHESGDWYKLRVLPYRTVDDRVDGVLMTFFEITDLKEAERRVEEMNEKLEARVQERTRELEEANEELQAEMEERERARKHFQKLFRLGPVAGIITALDNGQILDVNQRYVELTGYLRGDLIGMRLGRLGIVDADRHERRYTILKSEGALRNEEVAVTTKEGKTIQMMFSHEVIEREGTSAVLALGVNVTAQKQAEKALREAKEEAEKMNELKTSFIANMSHEIRTPLTGIIGFADILDEQVEDDEDRQHVQYIQSNGRRLLETLDSILDLARLDADEITLDPSPVELRTFVEETLALFEVQAKSKNVDLEFQVPDPFPRLRLDQNALQRILNNLLGNAVKFTEEGRVTLALALDSAKAPKNGTRQLRLTVSDTGIGMSASFQEKLFEEFAQENTGLTRSHEGAGLGLAITSRLVSLMDGSIDVESEKGEGTTFILHLPCQIVETDEAAESKNQPVLSALDQDERRVLVIDDRPEVGVIVDRFLEEYDITVATSAPEGLDMIERDGDRYHLALIDIQLGNGHSGIDLLHQLRSHRQKRTGERTRVPAVAMTAHSLPGDRQRFLEEGFDDYLGKPFTRSDIRKKVREVLGADAAE